LWTKLRLGPGDTGLLGAMAFKWPTRIDLGFAPTVHVESDEGAG